jgi:hypothetical protein
MFMCAVFIMCFMNCNKKGGCGKERVIRLIE